MKFFKDYQTGDLVKANFFCGVILEKATTATHHDAEFDTLHEVPLRNPLYRVRLLVELKHRWVEEGTAQIWVYDDVNEYWLFPDEMNLVCRAADPNYPLLLQVLSLGLVVHGRAA